MNELTLSELRRLIGNMIRFGTVLEVDYLMETARVQTGRLQTDWIRWGADRAGDAVTWWAPSENEQVVLLAPDGALENAVIVCSLYSRNALPPDNGKTSRVTRHPDGAQFGYDPSAGALTEKGIKTALTEVSETMTLNIGRLVINAGEIIINGEVIQGGGAMSSNGIVVHTHKHGDVKMGTDYSGAPV